MRDNRFTEATRSTEDTEEDVARINTRCRTLHGEGVGRSTELGRSLGEATREYQRTEDRRAKDRRSEDIAERRMGVGVGERRFEDGTEVTRVTEEFRYTEDTLRRMELEPRRSEAFWETEKGEDIQFNKMDLNDNAPKQLFLMQKQRWNTWMDNAEKCPAQLKFARERKEKMPKEGLQPDRIPKRENEKVIVHSLAAHRRHGV